MTNDHEFQNISSEGLSQIAGGGFGSFVKGVAKGVGKAAGAAYGAFQGYQGSQTYYKDRAHGKGVLPSLWDGVKKSYGF